MPGHEPTGEQLSDALALGRQLGGAPVLPERNHNYECPVPNCSRGWNNEPFAPICPKHSIQMVER